MEEEPELEMVEEDDDDEVEEEEEEEEEKACSLASVALDMAAMIVCVFPSFPLPFDSDAASRPYCTSNPS